jgi:exonuclease III
MPYIYKVATININGIRSEPRHDMLVDFLHKQDIDTALLQEVTQPGITAIQRYTAWINLGNERRGTAILTRDGITVT